MSDIRAVIEEHAGGLEDIAAATGKSIHTVTAYAQGKVPRGAPPFPSEVKRIGGKDVRIYCIPEGVEWIKAHTRP